MIVKFEGGKELERALAELPKATGKNVVTRTLNKAANPIDDKASSLAPVLSGALERSVVTGKKLTRSQGRGSDRFVPGLGFRSESKNYVEIHVGTAQPRGMFMEFGTFKDHPQPFLGPAWDQEKLHALEIIKS